jgi:hypothetical protein
MYNRKLKSINMNFRALLSIFALLISSISALSVVDFPHNLKVEPGSDLKLTLEGNDIAKGDYVRVELWDNIDDEDVNAVVLGEDLKVRSDNTVNVMIPSEFPKTKNAFVRVFYKCHNAVTPRFAIKSDKSCLTTKTPSKPIIIHPTPVATPSIIYKPPCSTPTGTPIIIYAPSVPVAAGGAGGPVAAVPTGTASVITSAVRTNSAKSTITTSTSSASALKASAGSVALAVLVAIAMFF